MSALARAQTPVQSTEQASSAGSESSSAGRGNAAAAEQSGLSGGSASVYVVAPGDTLWAIAARMLGDGSRWEELAALNQIADASTIFPGQMIRLPATTAAPADAPAVDGPTGAVLGTVTPAPADAPTPAKAPLGVEASAALEDQQAQESATEGGFWSKVAGAVQRAVDAVRSVFSGLFGGGKSEAPQIEAPAPEGPTQDGPTQDGPTQDGPTKPKTPTAPAVPEPEPAPVYHTVYPGDNLWSIAQQYLGDGNRWREVADANGLENPSLLKVGQKLLIPGVKPAVSGPITTPVGPTVDPDMDGEGMTPGDAIPLAGLRGLDHTMAAIYNGKGKYLKQKASALGISSAAAAAVLKCESGGEGFHRTSGKMIIRFENHIFWDKWGKGNAGTFNDHFRYGTSQRWTGHQYRAQSSDAWASFHGNQSKEWQVLELARGLDDTAALLSISMGAAQVMGFNHKTLGYANVQEMFESMSVSLPSQLDGMFAYIQASRTCMAGLKSGDYTQFARGYNGSGQAEYYGGLIAGAAAAYARVTRGRIHA